MSAWKQPRRVAAVSAVTIVALVVPTGASTRVGLRWSPRPLAAAAIDAIDAVPGVGPSDRPRSDRPVAGIAFVRCTRLWTALPDGSHARLIMEMPGIASPSFSPDGRTIAFLRTGGESPEIWMVAADGSDPRRVGTLDAAGFPVDAEATGLSWSPDGDRLVLALVSPEEDPWAGGSVIWKLDLATGAFAHVENGWPRPTWVGRQLLISTLTGGAPGISEAGGPARTARRLAGELPAIAVATTDGSLTAGRTVALLVHEGDAVALRVGLRGGARHAHAVAPPEGYAIAERARLAVAQDGGSVLVDLVDERGGPVLGVLDVSLGSWTVHDYAWEPAASPVPMATGTVEERRAMDAAAEALGASSRWNGFVARSGLVASLLPFPRGSFVLEPARRRGQGWVVPAVAFGRSPEGFASRRLEIGVEARHGRLLARPRPAGAITAVETVADAAALLGNLLHAELPVPGVLPPGARLAPFPVTVWERLRPRQATLSLHVPTPAGARSLSIQFGEASFALGCGAPEEVVPVSVDGVPGLLGRLGQNLQVIWPATLDHQEGAFGVWGALPEEQLLAIAASMRPAG